MSRHDLTVTMSYYEKLTGSSVTFDLYDSKKHKLAEVRGTPSGPKQLKNQPLGSLPEYPSYEIITVNGTVDIVEHRRMEPVFYLTDDVEVWKELGVSANNRWRGP